MFHTQVWTSGSKIPTNVVPWLLISAVFRHQNKCWGAAASGVANMKKVVIFLKQSAYFWVTLRRNLSRAISICNMLKLWSSSVSRFSREARTLKTNIILRKSGCALSSGAKLQFGRRSEERALGTITVVCYLWHLRPEVDLLQIDGLGSQVVEQMAEEDSIPEGLGQVEYLRWLPRHPVVRREHLAVDQPQRALPPVLHHYCDFGRASFSEELVDGFVWGFFCLFFWSKWNCWRLAGCALNRVHANIRRTVKPVEKKKKRNRALVEMRGTAPEMTVRCTEAVDGAHPALFSSLYLSLSLSHSHTLPPSLSLSLSLSLSPSLSTVSLPSPSPSSSPLPLATHRSVARSAKEKKNEMTATRQNITQVCGGEKKKKDTHSWIHVS